MQTFDPASHGFVLLQNFRFPGEVAVYELGNHPKVDGAHDFLRLNLYLSLDGGYATIWHGLLEPIAAETKLPAGTLANIEKVSALDVFSSYGQTLFRGFIDSAEAAAHIFKALRIDDASPCYALPQVLSSGPGNELRCDMMKAVD